MFNRIAPFYDFLNRFLSLGIDIYWRKKTVNKLKPFKPQVILDIATGTADVAIQTYKTIKPESITGLDISEEMLNIGRKKINQKGLSDKISLIQGDSENLPFKDNTFDAITVAYGVRNFENLEKGLAEIYRVLKPGGIFLVLEFSRPSVFPVKQLYNFYFKNILPIIGRITSKDPKAYSYLYSSVQAFPDGEDFLNIMNKLNFTKTYGERLTFGICSIYSGQK